MKLLLVTNLFPTPYDPERGIFTLQLVKRLKLHCEVTVVCPLPWFPRWKPFRKIKKYAQFSNTPDLYTIDGIEVHSPKYPLIPKLSENYHSAFMSYGIRRYIRKLHEIHQFDAVNSQWLYPDSVAMSNVLEDIPVPHIATGLGCDINQDAYEPIKGGKILQALKNCAAVTVVSEGLKNELISLNIDGQKISVIPNGIDTERFKILDTETCRDKLGIDTEVPLILYVGRLSEEKNVKTLIQACAAVIQNGSKIKAYIIGDGPLRQELTQQSQDLGIQDQITFVGKVDHSQVGLWMGAANYFCLPSLREGCPNVILEALGSGRPVIASRVGAIPDVVTDKSGILFTPQNVEELSAAIEKALAINWSAQEITASVAKLSWEHAAEQYIRVFKATSQQEAALR